MQKGLVLQSDVDLEYAKHFRAHVVVLQQHEIIDSGGHINSFDKYSVKIEGNRYLRSVCQFKVL